MRKIILKELIEKIDLERTRNEDEIWIRFWLRDALEPIAILMKWDDATDLAMLLNLGYMGAIKKDLKSEENVLIFDENSNRNKRQK